MATWEEIRAHLRETFTVTRDDAHAMALRFTEKPGEQELVQGLGLAPLRVLDRPFLTMIAEIAVEQNFPIRTALLYQDRLPFGGLILRTGTYLLRHGVPLETPLDQLDWTIRLLAQEAIRMRVNLKTLAPGGDPFTNYSD